MANANDIDQAIFWNEEGGQRWVRHIDQLESMLAEMSERLLVRAAARPGEQVLDIGCGSGITSAALAGTVGAGGKVLGLDISAIILDLARRRYEQVSNLGFAQADAASYAFTPASFDLLISRFGVMFFPDPAAAFTNIRRAARPAARLVFMCWRGLDENPWMGAAAAAAFKFIAPPEKPAPGAPGPFSFAKSERVRDILATAGFGHVTLEPVDLPMRMGTVESAFEWLNDMGPAAQPLKDASEEGRTAARAAMRQVLEAHATGGQVVLPGATWLVSARAG